MRVSAGCETDVGVWRGGPVTFGRGRLVPVHLRIEDAVAHDGGEGGGLGLEVRLEERLVELLDDRHQRLGGLSALAGSSGFVTAYPLLVGYGDVEGGLQLGRHAWYESAHEMPEVGHNQQDPRVLRG